MEKERESKMESIQASAMRRRKETLRRVRENNEAEQVIEKDN